MTATGATAMAATGATATAATATAATAMEASLYISYWGNQQSATATTAATSTTTSSMTAATVPWFPGGFQREVLAVITPSKTGRFDPFHLSHLCTYPK